MSMAFHSFTPNLTKIKFVIAEPFPSRTSRQIMKGLDKVRSLYEARGFNIDVYHGDNEFDINSVKEHVKPAKMHICAKEEHIHVIKHSTRTVKERARCNCHALPYKCYPRIMVDYLVKYVVK